MSSSEEVDNPATVESSESEDDIWIQELLKKRVSDPNRWKKNIAKRKRNSGEAYVGVGPTKRHVEAKALGPPCTCPRKCYEVVGADNAQLIFKNYWKMGNHNAQTSYLVNLVNTRDVKNCYAGPDSRRKKTHEYSVLVNNKKVIVCKMAFCNIHAISARRVLYAVNKLGETGVIPVDKRGTGRSVNRTPDDYLQLVHDHIKSLPTWRPTSRRRVYPPPGYSQQACYDLYVKMCTEKGVTDKQVKLEKYMSVMRSYSTGVDSPKLPHPSTVDRKGNISPTADDETSQYCEAGVVTDVVENPKDPEGLDRKGIISPTADDRISQCCEAGVVTDVAENPKDPKGLVKRRHSSNGSVELHSDSMKRKPFKSEISADEYTISKEWEFVEIKKEPNMLKDKCDENDLFHVSVKEEPIGDTMEFVKQEHDI